MSSVSGCSTHANCTAITCALNFTGQGLSLRVDIFRCMGMVATTTIVNAPDESSRYWHTFDGTGVETVDVPGFPYMQWKGFLYVMVELRVSLTDYCGLFWVEVELLAGGDLAEGGSSYPVRETVMNGLFVKTSCSGEFQDYETCDSGPTDYSFEPLDSVLSPQMLYILLPVLVTIQLVTFICCCYHWCRRRRSAPTEDAVSRAPAVTLRDLVTMRIPDIPMRQLVNETEDSAKV